MWLGDDKFSILRGVRHDDKFNFISLNPVDETYSFCGKVVKWQDWTVIHGKCWPYFDIENPYQNQEPYWYDFEYFSERSSATN